jgi:hypothetical protein
MNSSFQTYISKFENDLRNDKAAGTPIAAKTGKTNAGFSR